MFALELYEFEQHEYFIVIRMSMLNLINLWSDLLRYFIDMMRVERHYKLSCLELLALVLGSRTQPPQHGVPMPNQRTLAISPRRWGRRLCSLIFPSFPLRTECSSETTPSSYLKGAFTSHSSFLPWKNIYELWGYLG